MTFSLYQASIPVFVRAMHNFAGFLEKGRADAEDRKIDPAVFLAARLAPDMLPLTRQVQIACDMVKNGAGRLAMIELPSIPDTETTFVELQARIAKTIAFLDTVSAVLVDGAEDRQIVLKFPGREMSFSGADYVTGFVLPNLYFHMTAAYTILRHNGVKIGKTDFMGG